MIAASSESKVTHNEEIKYACPTLAGTIARTLADPATDRFSEDDAQFLKFHGIYQQDDRDKRKTGKQYLFMVRGRLPGGVVTPEQYLAFDRLAQQHGNNTLRITSRQGFQFHGVVKLGLGPLLRGIHESLATTLAACGDVNRNVMAPPTPARDAVGAQVLADAKRVSDALLPQTRAYHSIWVEGTQLDLGDPANLDFTDPLYGKTYLPRKFKVAFAIPPLNDVDLLTNCLGFIAIAEDGQRVGYNLAAGGGLGMSHGNAATFPRLADLIGYFTPEHLIPVAQAVLTVHRDFGDRTNRRHARLKYVLAEKGADWFRAEVEQRAGIRLEAVRPFEFTRQGDSFGWQTGHDGQSFLGLYVETGRIRDVPGHALKTALRQVVEQFHPEVRLTPSQNLLLTRVDPAQQTAIATLLAEHGVGVDRQASAVRRASMACPALPTCGLALAESERLMPDLLTRLEELLSEVGLADEEIVVRLTGCPNGCARPYNAELGLVGKAPGKYQIYLGGNVASTRLNRLFRESVKEADLVAELRPLLAQFARERVGQERFGDWCARVVLGESATQARAAGPDAASPSA
ncbi:MAG: NADPH-dependent assimilatory sulfite reductase hemoprotein subunit [Verrucomicrobia bacterium]|nr:NADPH-dependent assimilatory sulfite reductase hemoprotein subunit [Verrucomicrobiota bacterium]